MTVWHKLPWMSVNGTNRIEINLTFQESLDDKNVLSIEKIEERADDLDWRFFSRWSLAPLNTAIPWVHRVRVEGIKTTEHHYVDDRLNPGFWDFSCFESLSMRLCGVLNPNKMRRDYRYRRLEYGRQGYFFGSVPSRLAMTLFLNLPQGCLRIIWLLWFRTPDSPF